MSEFSAEPSAGETLAALVRRYAAVPVKRPCKAGGCDAEAAPRRQLCYEHWIAKQAPVHRADAAARRLALIPETHRRARIKEAEWPEGRRWCAGCQCFVRLEDVSGSRCKACASITSHLSRVRNEFGIMPSEYHHLLELQGGRCAICRGRPTTARLAIDHDHRCCKKPPFCGKCTRGLLCSRCNHELLGAAHDSVQILVNAVAYLKRPPASGEWELPADEREKWRKEYGTDDPAPF